MTIDPSSTMVAGTSKSTQNYWNESNSGSSRARWVPGKERQMLVSLPKGVVKTMLASFRGSVDFPALLIDGAGTYWTLHARRGSKYRAVGGRLRHHLAVGQEAIAIAGQVNAEENVRSG
jgi:hypothetical protein